MNPPRETEKYRKREYNTDGAIKTNIKTNRTGENNIFLAGVTGNIIEYIISPTLKFLNLRAGKQSDRVRRETDAPPAFGKEIS